MNQNSNIIWSINDLNPILLLMLCKNIAEINPGYYSSHYFNNIDLEVNISDEKDVYIYFH